MEKHFTKELLNANDLQIITNLSRTVVYQLLNRADLPVVCIGKRRFMHRELFESWLAEQAMHGKVTNDGINV